MQLTKEQRAPLRKAMSAAFTQETLDLFLQDRMDVTLADIISVNAAFEIQCQSLIQWAERKGRIDEFCQEIRNDIEQNGGHPGESSWNCSPRLRRPRPDPGHGRGPIW